MKYLTFIIKTAFEDFRRNKMRTFLTSLGILIGVSSVVLLIAMGLGLKKYIEQQFESMGSNTVFVMPGDITRSGPRSSIGGIRFDEKDVKSLKKINNIQYIVPVFIKFSTVKGEIDDKVYEISASSTELFDVSNVEADIGRLFEKSDADRGKKVAVLGPKAAEALFGNPYDALNENITIEESSFKVVGITK
ncbi:ABC transporter permease, partial [Patescibacteria group bacterium]